MSRTDAVAIGNHLYALGGLTKGDVSTDAVIQVDPTSNTATRVGTLTNAVHDAGGTTTGNDQTAMIFGGGAATITSGVQSWSQTGSNTVGTLPQKRADLVAVSVGGQSIVLGGTNGTTLDADVLATSDGHNFKVLGQLAQPVRYPAVAVVGNVVWLFGGETQATEGGTVARTDVIQRFDVTNGTASIAGHLPTPISHAMAFTHGGNIFVAGGRTATGATADILKIDLANGASSPDGSLPDARSDAGAATIGNVTYLLGGERSGPADALTSVVEINFG